MEFDASSVVIKVGIFFLTTKFLRKYFETEQKNPFVDNILSKAWIGALIISIAIYTLAGSHGDIVFYYWLFAFIIYCTWKLNDPKISRMVLTATLPIFFTSTIIQVFKEFFPKLLDSISTQIYALDGFANTWLIGFSIYTFWQSKKERQLRQKEIDEHNKLMAEKNTLEYQVAERTAEITKQKNKLEKTIDELKATQNQLIQSEKLASLGELTAGIAHEIQNPLNFVNNFSELSVELANELKAEIDKDPPSPDGAVIIRELVDDLIQNQEKIHHHGKRASSIVKGMLQHSRTSAGAKEPTDINALADEYLRLAYHGLRAKEKSFNSDFKTNFDEKLPKINLIPQDIGRVLLNLINNAFYACTERSRSDSINDFKPLVTVSTKLIEEATSTNGAKMAVISIKDNGTGMSKETQTKIFQPFFTTKPTGQG
ncbi:MAG: ATP-binding protein, partial [Bacteroidota bacterium]